MILSQRSDEANIKIEFYIRQICTRIKTIREEKYISQDTIGKALGISGQAYGKIEKGSTDIRFIQLCIISEFLKIPFNQLLQIEASDSVVAELQQTIDEHQKTIENQEGQIDKDKIMIDLLTDKLKSK